MANFRPIWGPQGGLEVQCKGGTNKLNLLAFQKAIRQALGPTGKFRRGHGTWEKNLRTTNLKISLGTSSLAYWLSIKPKTLGWGPLGKKIWVIEKWEIEQGLCAGQPLALQPTLNTCKSQNKIPKNKQTR